MKENFSTPSEGWMYEVIHNGIGKAKVKKLFLGQLEMPVFIHYVIMPARSSVGYHTHIGSEEVYLFLNGGGKMVIDNKEILVSGGDAVLTKSGSTHAYFNKSEETHILVIGGKTHILSFIFGLVLNFLHGKKSK